MRFYLLAAAATWLAVHPGRAQTTPPAADLLSKAEQLVQRRQYETAYQLLDQVETKL